MEPVGFFSNDIGEPRQALEEQVFVKKLIGGPEGLEISPAGPNPGIGDGIRRMKAMNRLDLTSLWRALIRRPAGKEGRPGGPAPAPRGPPTPPTPSPASPAAGMTTPPTHARRRHPRVQPSRPTPPPDLRYLAVNLVQASNTLGVTGEWQWTVRKKGLVPK